MADAQDEVVGASTVAAAGAAVAAVAVAAAAALLGIASLGRSRSAQDGYNYSADPWDVAPRSRVPCAHRRAVEAVDRNH